MSWESYIQLVLFALLVAVLIKAIIGSAISKHHYTKGYAQHLLNTRGFADKKN